MTPPAECPFCVPKDDRIAFEGPLTLGLWDAFPVSPGHLLVVPRRHVPTWFDATAEEQTALMAGVDRGRELIASRHAPDGFNIGINVGAAAGQTVFHLHVHLIPRYEHDVPDPRGGVRHVIPGKGNYPVPSSGASQVQEAAPTWQVGTRGPAGPAPAPRLVYGSEGDPLLPHLGRELAQAANADIAVGFVMRSGLEKLAPHLRDFLRKRGRLRLLTGDDLGHTDPVALIRLLDLEGDRQIRVFETVRLPVPELPGPSTDLVFHPKAYIFERADGTGVAFVGSSNLSESALLTGIEWNYRAVAKADAAAFEEIRAAFDRLFRHPATRELTEEWINAYRKRRQERELKRAPEPAEEPEEPTNIPTPHAIQHEALRALEKTREEGNTAGLVVLATGLGKTWLSAFDSNRESFRRVLFVAHREEILNQSRDTFRRILPRARLGRGPPRRGPDLPPPHRPLPPEVPARPHRHAGAHRRRRPPRPVRREPRLRLRPGRRRQAGPPLPLPVLRRAGRGRLPEHPLAQLPLRRGGAHPPRRDPIPSPKRLRAAAEARRHPHPGLLRLAAPRGLHGREDLDLPELDTVLMLRPTESRILWLQQFGRGLRKTDDDKQLTVIDYIGNHRTFLLKPQTLFSLPPGGQEVLNLLERARKGPIEIAPGCFVTYELDEIDILKGLIRVTTDRQEALKRYYEEFVELHGARPRAVEAFHEGYNPRAARAAHGSWLDFAKSQGGLDAAQSEALERHRAFLGELEDTPMTKSYKMLVLLAMLNEDAFPGEITIDALAEATRALASRNHRLVDDLGPNAATPQGLKRHLEQNPIEAWTGGRGTGGTPYFTYENGTFRSALKSDPDGRAALQELTREIAEWRLAEYLERLERQPGETSYLCKVSHANGRPILFLPKRAQNPGLPMGPTPVTIDGTVYEADFVKVALNVVRAPGDDRNRLPEILRGWFGPDAGLPGTRHEVSLEQDSDGWQLRPSRQLDRGLQLWRRYPREQIPALFGLPFSTAIWNAGFVVRPGHVFLLVTLDKSGKSSAFQYRDRFLSPTLFQWESQNRTRRDDSHGRLISSHKAQGVPVHLFVRKTSKISGGGSAPFVYCGDVEFVEWEGEKPITVRWRLPQSVPQTLGHELSTVPSAN